MDIMSADNLEGKEVDLLIQELASPPLKPAAPKPVVSPQLTATAVAPTAPAPGPRATTRAFAPGVSSNRFVSAIRLRPAIKSMGLPEFELPVLGETALVRMWVGLGVALAVALPFWPYPKASSWWLLLYMMAVALLIVTGVWSARLTWVTRLGIAHTVALTVVFWGFALVAGETLPRIGYAKTEAVWFGP
jgi:hypothetical protein